jgi:outer membrane protein assembly factor BamB
MAVLTAVSLVTAACAGSSKLATPGVAPLPAGSWPYPNGDLANTRDAAGSVISSANVSKLQAAWTFPLTGAAAAGDEGAGALAAAPIVVNGVVYIQDLDANVYALALATGKLKWEHTVGTPEKSGPGPNGVAVAGGRVYGDSPTAAFALNASTGKPVWVSRHLLGQHQGTFSIQPQVAGGRVYLASGYGSAPGGGILVALSAATGAVRWKFSTVTGPDPGVQAAGVGAGGAWQTPLVSSDGSVTFGTGNPYQTAQSAISHPARLLYTDSDVNLSAATGRLRWYYQGVPDDFKDYDMQASPVSAQAGQVQVVLGSGKMGIVYEMNARTGKLIWKTPVGEHNGHDSDSLLALAHRSTLKAPFTILPGSIGGVLTNMAVAGQSVYVTTCDLAFTDATLDMVLGKGSSKATGEITALSLRTGKVEWDTKVADLPLGAATVSNDLIFTTLLHGELIALNRRTGAIVFRHQLPTSTNSPIAIAGNTVLVPAGDIGGDPGHPQLVAYTVPAR